MRRWSEEGSRRRTEHFVSEAVPLGSFEVADWLQVAH